MLQISGDVVHFLLPNNTEYHSLTIGVWLCEGICSVADPSLAVPVLKSQLEDTKAKFILCYEKSRHNVFQVLKETEMLGKVKVFVLEKTMPEENEDKPIAEEGFQFIKDFKENAEKMPQPPMLQDGLPKDDDTYVIFWSSGNFKV